MTRLFPATSPSASITCLSLIAVVAALAGCGGGSDETHQQDVALLAGDWQSQRCQMVGDQSERSLLHVVSQDAAQFTQQYGAVRYANSDCTGSATVRTLPLPPATLVAHRTGATAGLTIFWANWANETADSAPRSLWVRKDGLLCTSSYATLTLSSPVPQAPHNYYDLERITRDTEESLQAQGCHTRVPA